ncbi:glycine-rich domain-containing protein [Nocardia miyunensis]|uniref:glycine-rich domain-containing protein n=1 Tax=Nocardia miyunensis TaxID=282684 RepID=UPI000834CEE8|nr:hypothetical protein [Nocardia miyunensis]
MINSAVPRRLAPKHELHEARIEGLREVRAYIDAIDLSGIKAGLTQPSHEGGRGWSHGMADYFEPMYRTWLFLRRKYEDELMPPHMDMDEFWHGHILDTRRYIEDCNHIFGHYFHHFPYFGIRGEGDRQNLLGAWENTQRRFYEETGDYVYDYDGNV